MFKFIFLVFCGLSLLTACGGGSSGGAGGGGNNPPIPNNPFFNPDDFNFSISPDSCNSPGAMFGESWEEKLASDIKFGEAACVKRDLVKGNLNVNDAISEWHGTPILPIWRAVDRTSIFFVTDKAHPYAVIKALVEAGAKLDVKNGSGQTPLHFAMQDEDIFTKYPNVAAYLILSGKAPFNVYDSAGKTPFHNAIERKSMAHMKLFVDQKANINFPTQSGKKNLLFAFEANSSQETLAYLLQNGIDAKIKDSQGNNAIQLAIRNKYEDFARTLITGNYGIDLNEMNNTSETALMTSVSINLDATSNLLLDRQVNVDLRPSSTTPLHRAIENKNAGIADRLLETVTKLNEKDQSQQTVVHLLVANGSEAQLSRAIARGFARDEKNNQGATPLLISVAQDYVSRVDILLNSGVNVNIQDTEGRPALSRAKSYAVVEKLLSKNANPNLSDNAQNPPLTYFISKGMVDAVNLLLSKGADLKWRHPSSGIDHLKEALQNQQLVLAQSFMAKGLNPNDLDANQENALFYTGNINAIEMLVSNKVNINQISKSGDSVLSSFVKTYLRAESDGVQAIIFKLLDLGADVNWTQNPSGENLLHILLPAKPFLKEEKSIGYSYKSLLARLLSKGIDVNKADNIAKNTPMHLADSVEEILLLAQSNATVKAKNKMGQTPLALRISELADLNARLQLETKHLEEAQQALDKAKKNGLAQNSMVYYTLQKEVNESQKTVNLLNANIDNRKKLVDTLQSIGG